MNRGSRMTEYDDRSSTCDETRCKLRIYPGRTSPASITAMLGVDPTGTVEEGSVYTNSLGRSRVGKVNGWFLSSEKEVDSKDLRRHLDWLITKLGPAAESLARVQQLEGMKMWVTCVWWSASGSGGPTLWPEQMMALANMNLECQFEFAYYAEAG